MNNEDEIREIRNLKDFPSEYISLEIPLESIYKVEDYFFKMGGISFNKELIQIMYGPVEQSLDEYRAMILQNLTHVEISLNRYQELTNRIFTYIEAFHTNIPDITPTSDLSSTKYYEKERIISDIKYFEEKMNEYYEHKIKIERLYNDIIDRLGNLRQFTAHCSGREWNITIDVNLIKEYILEYLGKIYMIIEHTILTRIYNLQMNRLIFFGIEQEQFREISKVIMEVSSELSNCHFNIHKNYEKNTPSGRLLRN